MNCQLVVSHEQDKLAQTVGGCNLPTSGKPGSIPVVRSKILGNILADKLPARGSAVALCLLTQSRRV